MMTGPGAVWPGWAAPLLRVPGGLRFKEDSGSWTTRGRVLMCLRAEGPRQDPTPEEVHSRLRQ